MANLLATTVSGDFSTSGQGRFTGWYTGNAATGLAAEIGTSGGQAYIIAYNRQTSSYGTLNLEASGATLKISGTTINASAGTLQQGGNAVIHAGNIGSQSVSYASTAGSAGSASTAGYIPTLYAGGVQANPQTYFGTTVGVRVAMTGSWSVWSDTLWINGYSGSDVRSMCALHFLRNAEPRFAISTQRCDADSYGEYYEVVTAYNIGSQSVNYAASAGTADNIDGVAFRNTGSNAGINADTIASNGITYYTSGVSNFSGNSTDGALYSQAYSSSWQHQIAGDYRSGQIALRGKNNGTWQAWRTVLDSSNAGYAWNMNQNVRTSDVVAFPEIRLNASTSRRLYGESVGAGYNCVRVQGNWETFDIMGRVLDWTGSNLHFGNGYNGIDHSSHYVIVGNPVSYFKVEGPIYATGDVIAYYSDRRLKQNIQPIDSALDIINKIGAYTFEWNKKSEEVWSKKEGDKDFGLISQEVEAVWPMGVAVQGGKDINDKYGYGDPNSEHYDPLHIEKNPEEYKTVRYDKMVTLAIAAIKEQQKQIEELKSIINGLTR